MIFAKLLHFVAAFPIAAIQKSGRTAPVTRWRRCAYNVVVTGAYMEVLYTCAHYKNDLAIDDG